MKVYPGGLPDHGFMTNAGTEMDAESPVQPQAGPHEVGMKKVELGSIESSGGTGQDLNPPAFGEEKIASRKLSSNQPS